MMSLDFCAVFQFAIFPFTPAVADVLPHPAQSAS